MSFTDQKRRVATEKECKAPWGGHKNGVTFRCYVCGHKFKPGDGWRFIFCPEVANFYVCDSCDKDDPKAKLIANQKEFKIDKFWWLRQQERDLGVYDEMNRPPHGLL